MSYIRSFFMILSDTCLLSDTKIHEVDIRKMIEMNNCEKSLIILTFSGMSSCKQAGKILYIRKHVGKPTAPNFYKIHYV